MAKDLSESSYPPQEIGNRLRITHDFARRKTLDQAKRFPWPVLEQLYAALLKADLAVKTGSIAQDVAMELTVSEMSGLVSKARSSPTRSRS